MNRARLTAVLTSRWNVAHSPLRLRLNSLPWLVPRPRSSDYKDVTNSRADHQPGQAVQPQAERAVRHVPARGEHGRQAGAVHGLLPYVGE